VGEYVSGREGKRGEGGGGGGGRLSIELSREATEVAGVPVVGLLGWEKTLETSVNPESEEWEVDWELPDSERGNLT
jgi:hypothetical protein